MTGRSAWLLWTPRLLALAVCVFIGLFALDAFSEGKPLAEAVPDFAVHLLPALLLLAVVAVAWRRPWFGGAAFLILGAGYALMARRLDWVLVISGPLWLVGLLFLWSQTMARPVGEVQG